jgi:hypothetical protein
MGFSGSRNQHPHIRRTRKDAQVAAKMKNDHPTTEVVTVVSTKDDEQALARELDKVKRSAYDAQVALEDFRIETEDRDWTEMTPAEEFVQRGADGVQAERLQADLTRWIGMGLDHNGGRVRAAERKLKEIRARMDGRAVEHLAGVLRRDLPSIGTSLGTLTLEPVGPVKHADSSGYRFYGTVKITVEGSPLLDVLTEAALEKALDSFRHQGPTGGRLPLSLGGKFPTWTLDVHFTDQEIKRKVDASKHRDEKLESAAAVGAVGAMDAINGDKPRWWSSRRDLELIGHPGTIAEAVDE